MDNTVRNCKLKIKFDRIHRSFKVEHFICYYLIIEYAFINPVACTT